jgi:formate dehydrogenase beta subunit
MSKVLFSCWNGKVFDSRTKELNTLESPAHISLPSDFFNGKDVKAFMGWGGFVIKDSEISIVNLCVAFLEKVQQESCGQCTPCRIGTKIMLEMMRGIAEGNGKKEDLIDIISLGEFIRNSSKCSIGQTSPTPVIDAITYFKDEFEAIIANKNSLETKGDLSRYIGKVTAPCINACPSHLNIPKYVEHIRSGRFLESLQVIRENTCLPGVLGRVCVRPCESNCRRGNVDEAVSIKHLKRFVADFESDRHLIPKFPKPISRKDKKVGIVGAGPAGITCAYYLAKKGYQVTVFERFGEPGGMSAMGIPDYRLPRSVLRREVEIIQSVGVEIRYNTAVGRDITMKKIKDEFDAIFIAVGAQGSSSMRVEGEDVGYKGFIPGVKYLLDINQGRDPYPEGKKIVVVGGGNVAIDCVRSSFRIGKEDVNLVYRRTRKEMPADDLEIKDAEEEGVKFHFLCNPTRIIAENGKVIGIELIKMELGEPDESGRRRPVPVEGSQFIIDTDILVPAIGQSIDLSFLDADTQLEVTRRNTIVVDPETMMTSEEGIFSAGDCVTGPGALVTAAGGGRTAALRMHEYLSGKPMKKSDDELMEDFFAVIGVYDPAEDLGIIGGGQRKQLTMMPPSERKSSFDEVESGFSVNEAIAEADRCLRCYRIGVVAL